MKKQFILALALSTVSLFACEEEPIAINSQQHVATAPAIHSFFPVAAACGEVVVISGENFGTSLADNHVTFSGAYAEVMEAQSGLIRVKIPQQLEPGDYAISVSANGLTCTSALIFKIWSN